MRTSIDLFIEPENQTLLWELIQECPLFALLPQPEIWFASVIEDVYVKALKNVTEGNDEIQLIRLNEFALYQMVTDLKDIEQEMGKQNANTGKQNAEQHNDTMHMQQQQQEMANWVIKDNQLRIDTTKDKPIKNMDDLLLEQQKRRDNEIPVLPKPQGEQPT